MIGLFWELKDSDNSDEFYAEFGFDFFLPTAVDFGDEFTNCPIKFIFDEIWGSA